MAVSEAPEPQLYPDADQVPSSLSMPLVKKTDVEPLVLKPPEVSRVPGGQFGVVAVPSPGPRLVVASTGMSRGRLLRVQYAMAVTWPPNPPNAWAVTRQARPEIARDSST